MILKISLKKLKKIWHQGVSDFQYIENKACSAKSTIKYRFWNFQLKKFFDISDCAISKFWISPHKRVNLKLMIHCIWITRFFSRKSIFKIFIFCQEVYDHFLITSSTYRQCLRLSYRSTSVKTVRPLSAWVNLSEQTPTRRCTRGKSNFACINCRAWPEWKTS